MSVDSIQCAQRPLGDSQVTPPPPPPPPTVQEPRHDVIIRVVVFEPGLPPYERPMRADLAPWLLIGGTSGETRVEWCDHATMYYVGAGAFNAAASLFADETICGNAVYVRASRSGERVNTSIDSMRERFDNALFDW